MQCVGGISSKWNGMGYFLSIFSSLGIPKVLFVVKRFRISGPFKLYTAKSTKKNQLGNHFLFKI